MPGLLSSTHGATAHSTPLPIFLFLVSANSSRLSSDKLQEVCTLPQLLGWGKWREFLPQDSAHAPSSSPHVKYQVSGSRAFVPQTTGFLKNETICVTQHPA